MPPRKKKTKKVKAVKPKAAKPKAAEARADWDVYQDDNGKHRWRLVANNGEVLAESGVGRGGEFKTREGAIRGIRLMRKAGGTAPLPT